MARGMGVLSGRVCISDWILNCVGFGTVIFDTLFTKASFILARLQRYFGA